MRINNSHAALAGAVTAAYASDIVDNPVTGLMSAGIGFGVGSLLALPQESLVQMAETLVVKQDDRFIKSRINSSMSREQQSFQSTFNRTINNNIKAPNNNRINFEENLKAISTKLKNDGIIVPKLEDGRKEFLESLKGLPYFTQKSISPLLSNNKLSLFNTYSVDANRIVNTELNIKSTLSRESKISALKNIFVQEMNNPIAEAEEKAKMIIDRTGTGNISIKAGVVSFNDINDENRRVNLPITSYDKNGVRYHNAGNGKAQAVKGFSPHGLILSQMGGKYILDGVEKTVTADDIRKGMSPEMILKYANKESRITSILPSITSNFMYDANEVSSDLGKNFVATSPQFINTSNQVNYGTVLNVDQNGKVRADSPLRELKTSSTEKGMDSESVKVRKYLTNNGFGVENLLGISNNDSTSIQGLNMSTISVFTPMERNITGASIRETSPVNKGYGIKSIHEIFKNSNILYSSSQVYDKIDIKDTNTFNSFLNQLTKSSNNTLGDGFGLYNRSHNSSIMNKSPLNINIPLDNNTIISNGNLLKALENGNIEQYLNNNPLDINNQPIAYNKDGSAIKLHDRFSSGTLTKAFKDSKGNLVLQGHGYFDPATEDSVKFFSVGSKAQAGGLDNNMFKTSAAFGLELNKGNIELNTNGTVTIKSGEFAGTHSIDSLSTLGGGRFINQAEGITLITDSNNTGAKELNKMFSNVEYGDSILKSARVPSLLKGDRSTALLTAYALSETKGAEDISASIIDRLYSPLIKARETGINTPEFIRHMENLSNRNLIPSFNIDDLNGNKRNDILVNSSSILSRRINQTFNNKNYIKNRERFTNQMRQLIDASGLVEDILQGRSSFIASTQTGAAIVGAGKEAKMSWTALKQLRLSGHKIEDLESFGKIDKNVLYELLSLEGEGSRSKLSQNVNGLELESILRDKLPEERSKAFSNVFGTKLDSNYISYNLGYDTGTIKSLNFGLNSTARVGVYDLEGKRILKELDKSKLNILSLDNEYSKAKGNKSLRESVKRQLDLAMSEYDTLRKTAITGENSLLKSAISLYSELGQTKVAAPIGGQSAKFVNTLERDSTGKIKTIVDKAFISKDHLEDILKKFKSVGRTGSYLEDPLIAGRTASYKVGNKRDGYSIKTFDIPDSIHTQSQLQAFANSQGYKKLKAKYHEDLFLPTFMDAHGKSVPLHAAITREPSQGIFTSLIADLVVDRTLKTGVNTFHTVEGQAAFGAASLDFDFDAPQMLLGDVTDSATYNRLKQTQSKVFNEASSTFEFLHELSPKGDEKPVRSITSFNSIEDFNEYSYTADIKGKIRKIHSPAVTSLAINYVDAINMSEGITSETKASVRVASYRLVENLLKSSHLDTANFLNTEQPIDILRLARDEFINKAGSSSEYKKVLLEQLPKALGFDGEDNTKNKWISDVVEHIADSEVNYSKRIDRRGNTPLDFNRIANQLGGDESVRQILSSSGLFETESVISKASAGQLYNNLGDAIVDTFKKNKGLILGGAAALVGINLIGQSEPSFEQSRRNAIMPTSKMLTVPKEDIDDMTVMPMSQSSNYIMPKSFTSRNVDVSANRTDQYQSDYSNIGSYEMFDPMKSLNDSIFGGGFRSGNIKITDL